MANSIKKRGQKFWRKFSRASVKASSEGKEHIKENLVERISHVHNVRLLVLEWGLLVVALIMLATTQAFWFGDSYAENVFTDGGTYTEATIGPVNSMNPLFAITDSEKTLSKLMFATISTIDYSGNPGNELAESITPNETGDQWTVKLRDGLQWSDGAPITVDDVIFTAKLIQNPAVSTIYGADLANVKVQKGEAGEVIFTLPTAYADFVSALNFPIVPEHILGNTDPKNLIENNFSNAPVTSGPFTFNAVQASAADGQKTVYLTANRDYFRGGPLLNTFAVHTYSDREEIIKALNSGLATATAELSGPEIQQVSAGQYNHKDSSLNSGAFIFFNLSHKVFKDANMRAAVRQGLDFEKIRSIATDTVALDFPLVESQIKLETYPELPGRDFEAAKAKVAELSGGEELNLDIATVKSGYLPDVTNEIAAELEALGFKVNVTTYEENQEFINNVVSKRSYDVLVYEVELGADPDLLPYYHSSQATESGLNLSNYKNAYVDDLLLGARDTLNLDLRVKKYEAFLAQWASDVPAIGLYQPNLSYVYNKNVRTFSNDVKLVTAIDRFTDVTDWAVNKTTKNKTP